VYDSSPPVPGKAVLVGSAGLYYASSASFLRILMNPARDVDSDIDSASSYVCVGSYDQTDTIMACTKLEDLIPCADEPESLLQRCFEEVTLKKGSPHYLAEVWAFFQATNGVGLLSIFYADPIYFDRTTPEIGNDSIFIQNIWNQNFSCSIIHGSLLKSISSDF